MFNQNPHCGACGHMNMRGFCNLTACPFPFPTNTAIGSYEIKPQTNADRIRRMTNDELAHFLAMVRTEDIIPHSLLPSMQGTYRVIQNKRYKMYKKWLSEKATDGLSKTD